MGKIHVLPEHVANKIAAGEVEASCGREPERSEGGSPQPKSRTLNAERSEGRRGGISPHG